MRTIRYPNATAVLLTVILFVGCSGGPLTTREKGAGIGALGGAAAGGLIGAAVGHPGAGAAIGGGLGLGAGALTTCRDRSAKTNNRSNVTSRKSSASV
jgi:hypothetical protein